MITNQNKTKPPITGKRGFHTKIFKNRHVIAKHFHLFDISVGHEVNRNMFNDSNKKGKGKKGGERRENKKNTGYER